VLRADIYEEAMKEIGYEHGGPNMEPETLFDGVQFDPAKPEEYALAFASTAEKTEPGRALIMTELTSPVDLGRTRTKDLRRFEHAGSSLSR
jgi:hypothetical protein